MERVRAVWVIGLVLLITAVMLPVHLVAMRLRWPLRKTTAQTWHRWVARAMGLHVRVRGEPAANHDHGVLLAANHASWLDIIALGATAPVSFIAKDEVRAMPGFGLLARLQDSVFVSRSARARSRAQAEMIANRLAAGDMMVLFAEGTTTSGNHVHPFKSSLFGAVGFGGGGTDGPRLVQPVAIAYTHVDGMAMGRLSRPLATWPGDIGIGPHLMRVLREGRIDISVAFGTPIAVTAQTDRKQLATQTEAAVRSLMSALLRGREPASTTGQKTLRTPA